MKYFVLWMTLAFSAQAQVIDFYYQKFNCDTAHTTLELGLCSKYAAERSVLKHDSLVVSLMECLDTLNAEDHRNRRKLLKRDPKQTFDFWTDYLKIKKMLLQSSRDFKHYADNDMYLEGEFYGPGRERSIGENNKLKEIYDRRIQDLTALLKAYCK